MKNKYVRRVYKFVNSLVRGRNDAFYIDLFVNGEMNSATPLPSENKRWEIIRRFIEDFVVSGGHRNLAILEVGCGRGWMSNLLTGYGEVVGSDPVSKVIGYARSLYPNVSFEVGTSQTMRDRHGVDSFDLVISSEVLEHVPISMRVNYAKDLHDMLRSDGFCVITTPRAEAENNLRKTFSQPVENWMTEGEVELLFNTVGFESIRIDRIQISQTDLYQVWIFKKLWHAAIS